MGYGARITQLSVLAASTDSYVICIRYHRVGTRGLRLRCHPRDRKFLCMGRGSHYISRGNPDSRYRGIVVRCTLLFRNHSTNTSFLQYLYHFHRIPIYCPISGTLPECLPCPQSTIVRIGRFTDRIVYGIGNHPRYQGLRLTCIFVYCPVRPFGVIGKHTISRQLPDFPLRVIVVKYVAVRDHFTNTSFLRYMLSSTHPIYCPYPDPEP